jgi:hypothetical protein
MQRMFVGVNIKLTFKRLYKIVVIIDKTSRALTCPLFATPMIKDRGLKKV